jgi:8-oxo-dGTP diphosphatase
MPGSAYTEHPTLRVRALIVSANHLLLALLLTKPVSFLPGGQVEPRESLVTALAREVMEECGAVAEQTEYLGAVENLWIENGQRIHDLSHYLSR